MTPEPSIVLGGPGTGKTSYLIDRLLEIIEQGVKPSDIAFISYTKKAVEEAKERARAKLGLSRRDTSNFRTLHSLCYREIGATRNSMMGNADYREVAGLLGMRYTAANAEDEQGFDASLDAHLALDNYARARMISPEVAWEQLGPDFSWYEHDRVARTISAYKLDTDKRDFSDLLSEYLQVGGRVPVSVAIVDEAQDLSTVQWRVAEKAFSGVEQLFIAGDDDQAIYKWSGADVERFVRLEGQEHVLPSSHRLPRAVFSQARSVVQSIGLRRDKSYAHTGRKGFVGWVSYIEQLPILEKRGSWFLLARNKYLLEGYRAFCKSEGIPFRTVKGSSIDPDHARAIIGWERIRKGRTIDSDHARVTLRFLGVRHKQPNFTQTQFAAYDFVKMGFNTDQPWFDALAGISAQQLSYYLTVLRNGYKLLDVPEVYIGTVHSVKGGEADNVALLTDMSAQSYASYCTNPDDEHRVIYVGVTRARESLYLVMPQTDRYFTI